MTGDSFRQLETILSNPEERAFLKALEADSDNDRLRLAYAEVLAARGDPRGEYLRVECLLAGRLDDPARRQALEGRLEQLAAAVNRLWAMLVARRSRILNCGGAEGEGPLVRFAYRCPNQWGMLAPTEESGVRFCESCRQQVYFCETGGEVRQHALSGHCVAISGQLAAAACQEQAPKWRCPSGGPTRLSTGRRISSRAAVRGRRSGGNSGSSARAGVGVRLPAPGRRARGRSHPAAVIAGIPRRNLDRLKSRKNGLAGESAFRLTRRRPAREDRPAGPSRAPGTHRGTP
jgi:uncharacterized protein (TIGR02996 family)